MKCYPSMLEYIVIRRSEGPFVGRFSVELNVYSGVK